MDNMLYHINAQRLRPGSGASLDILNAAEARRARRFHAGFVQYAPTPLVPLPYLASTLGLGNIRAKDESKRFGLNAFKVLGASYAMGRYLAERLGKSIDDLTPADLAALCECASILLRTLYPIAPHITTALWQELGFVERIGDLIDAPWPEVSEDAIKADELKLVVQVNGKLRGEILVPAEAAQAEIEAAALANPDVQRFTEGMTVRKIIIVKNKLVNVVVAK